MTEPLKWTKAWPNKVGWYWFYGWKFGKSDDFPDPELCMCRVFQGANSLIHTCDGQFFYRSEGATGYFLDADLPQVPEID